MDHIVNQVVSGGTETSEEPGPLLVRNAWATSEAQVNENR